MAIKKAFIRVCALCQFGPILRTVDQTERLNLVSLALAVKIENPNNCVTDKKSQFNPKKKEKKFESKKQRLCVPNGFENRVTQTMGCLYLYDDPRGNREMAF